MLDFSVMIIKSLALKAVELGGEAVGIPGLGVFADCVLESVANSQPLSLREAPSLGITCLSNIGDIFGIGSVQFWMQQYFRIKIRRSTLGSISRGP